MIRPLSVILAIASASIASAFGSAAVAQSPAVTPAQEAAIAAGIKELSARWSTAILEKDAAILERIWADEFVAIEPSGARVSKAEGIAALAAGKDRPTVSEATSIDVRVYGGGTVAVDIGDYREAGEDRDGKPYERRSRFTNVWVLRDGVWRCVSGHSSLLEPTR